MHITQVTSELTPLVKVGGLADVVQGLSKELVRCGHTVDIFLPKYDCIDKSVLQDLQIECPRFEVRRPEGVIANTLFSATVDRLKIFLIEPHDPSHFFKRGSVYGCPDETDRFIYFCQATLQALIHLKKTPDILHLHDWPTSLLALLFNQLNSPFKPKGVVLTIHNMHHQGKGSSDLLSRSGIPFQEKEGINLLKLGIECATQVTTVSPQYRKEIDTVEGSCGLQETILNNRSKIHGILNGIDVDFWDPANDRYVDFHYLADGTQLTQVIEGKEKNKAKLCASLGLAISANTPLVAVITRLVPQKSPELIKHALYRTLEKGGQFILLGSSPIPEIQAQFETLQRECLQGNRARIIMDNDEGLAHQIYAASDLFLIPSLFEPCGLTQLIAMRYGSVPVARVTGGLANTVFDIDSSSLPQDKRNGFTFDHPDTEGIDWALIRALDCYKNDPKKWRSLIGQGMAYDFSWRNTTPDYVHVYNLSHQLSNASLTPS